MIIFLRLTAHSDKNAALRETASFIRDGTQSEEVVSQGDTTPTTRL